MKCIKNIGSEIEKLSPKESHRINLLEIHFWDGGENRRNEMNNYAWSGATISEESHCKINNTLQRHFQ